MKLTRRAFHRSLVATALLAALPVRASVRPIAGDVLLNRLTFGATAASRAELAAFGPDAWLSQQLSLPPDDASLQVRLQGQGFDVVAALL